METRRLRSGENQLARRELIIAVQEWLARVPLFGVDEMDKIEMRASGVFGLENLHFKWTRPDGD